MLSGSLLVSISAPSSGVQLPLNVCPEFDESAKNKGENRGKIAEIHAKLIEFSIYGIEFDFWHQSFEISDIPFKDPVITSSE